MRGIESGAPNILCTYETYLETPMQLLFEYLLRITNKKTGHNLKGTNYIGVSRQKLHQRGAQMFLIRALQLSSLYLPSHRVLFWCFRMGSCRAIVKGSNPLLGSVVVRLLVADGLRFRVWGFRSLRFRNFQVEGVRCRGELSQAA